MGVRIVGVSFNDVEALSAWAEEEAFGFELWQDTDKTLAVHYGAAASTATGIPSRVTVVLDSNGDQILNYDVGWGFGTHPSEVLADLTILWGK